MLAYSGRGSFAIGPVVLEDLLGEIGNLMSRSIAKGARLRYDFAPGLPPVLADVTELRQVALNLIVNASDALGGRRGDITLRTAMTTLAPDDPDVIPGAPAEPGDYVMLEVSDTGSGMDDATLLRIFEPFFSTKSVGRGLGLAATMGIVKGHGGAIRVRSARGEGSTFQVLLRPTDRLVQERDSQPARPPEQTAAGRILLVDDEPSVRQIGRRILERAGFGVEEAADGPEALERFRADPAGFGAVLLDLTLPSMDGLTVMRELRALRDDVGIVLCSGWSADEVAGTIRAMPRTLFLQKPYQRQALVEALVTVARPSVPSA
jgi:CheY-like chemotaxis protein